MQAGAPTPTAAPEASPPGQHGEAVSVPRRVLRVFLYQRELTPYERSVDVHISHLRKKLERPGAEIIRTVRGVGYLFVPDSAR